MLTHDTPFNVWEYSHLKVKPVHGLHEPDRKAGSRTFAGTEELSFYKCSCLGLWVWLGFINKCEKDNSHGLTLI